MPDGTSINVHHGVGATGPKYDVVQFPKENKKRKYNTEILTTPELEIL